jgi:hypothetical protein
MLHPSPPQAGSLRIYVKTTVHFSPTCVCIGTAEYGTVTSKWSKWNKRDEVGPECRKKNKE